MSEQREDMKVLIANLIRYFNLNLMDIQELLDKAEREA